LSNPSMDLGHVWFIANFLDWEKSVAKMSKIVARFSKKLSIGILKHGTIWLETKQAFGS
jgi:hypothetical protein